MIEYGTGNSRVGKPSGTCFYPRHVDDLYSVLCDRCEMHLGRHAAWDDNGKRVYWDKEPL